MKATVKKIAAVKGFIQASYAVYAEGEIVKIFMAKQDATLFADKYNKERTA